MKTSKVLKVLSVLVMSYALLGCSLNESEDGKLVANQLRGSSTGGMNPNGKKSIDLGESTGRPAKDSPKWAQLSKDKYAIEQFLGVAAGVSSVPIAQDNFSHVGVYFWGNAQSSSGQSLQLGNPSSEQAYFQNLNKEKFQFELTIWDYFTGKTNTSTNEKYDYLGYVYFGKGYKATVGQMTSYQYNYNSGVVGMVFSDSRGHVLVEFSIPRNGSTFSSGAVYFANMNGSGWSRLGNFSNMNFCSFFKCQ